MADADAHDELLVLFDCDGALFVGDAGEAADGAADALAALTSDGFRLALLAGTAEETVRTRLGRAGLGEFFPSGQGAFGSESDERGELYGLALRRAGAAPSRAVAVGDTSRDVTMAQALGIRCILVAHGDTVPAGADLATRVVGSMPELVSALRDLRSALSNGAGH
jgi:phosphoglycolate phosphatase-like HAD superfamily hydrolase